MDSSTMQQQQQQQQQQIFGDKKLKRKLIQSVKSVKKKLKSLNEGKVELTSTLQDTFQPITTPLNSLLKQMNSKNKAIKGGKKKTEQISSNNELDDSVDDDSYEDADGESDSNNSTIIPESMTSNAITPIMKTYLDSAVINKVEKVPYGIHLQPDGYYVGDSIINFNENYLTIKNVKFKCTPGLMELLFKRDPQISLIQPADSDNYRKIITMTNAHRRNFLFDGQIQGDRSIKYSKYIKQLSLPSASTKTGGCLTSSSSANKLLMKKYTPNTDFKYWDDPNELVDRLRLLIASQNAGNNAHDNEIIAIIEELQEANIIEPPQLSSQV